VEGFCEHIGDSGCCIGEDNHVFLGYDAVSACM
jgi:hypothetical protein